MQQETMQPVAPVLPPLKTRNLPDIGMDPVPEYAKLAAKGWDGWSEAINMRLPDMVMDELERQRQAAAERSMDDPVSVMFGGLPVQISPRRARGVVCWIKAPAFDLMLRPMGADWPISARINAAGLWQYGRDVCRHGIYAMLQEAGAVPADEKGGPDTWHRVSRADYAVDLYCPDFAAEMIPALANDVVAGARVKVKGDAVQFHGVGTRLETLTIGVRGAALQNQVYDKGQEIKAASGKYWMLDLWARNGVDLRDRDDLRGLVWRVEMRFKSDFLKNRRARTADAVDQALEGLLGEALLTRRLTVDNGDRNRARRPLHPIWAAALHEATHNPFMIPLGAVDESKSRADRIRRLEAGAAGYQRSLAVLKDGEFDRDIAEKTAESITQTALKDPENRKKVERAKDRYAYAAEAK